MYARLMTILGCCLICQGVGATPQIPDILFDQDKEHVLDHSPMEQYFAVHPERRPNAEIRSPSLKRGYLAFFEIRDDELVLRDIKVQGVRETQPKKYSTIWTSVLASITPDGAPLKIHWFSGLLVLPQGSIVNYVDTEKYGARYTQFRILEVHNGRVTQRRNFTGAEYDAFKTRQFEAYRQTRAYSKQRSRMVKDGHPQGDIDATIKASIMTHITRFLDTAPQR